MKQASSEKKRFPLNIIDILVILLLVAVVVIVVKKVTAVKTQQAAAGSSSRPAIFIAPDALDHGRFNVRFEAVAEDLDPAFAETVKASVEQDANRIENAFTMQDAYITQVTLEASEKDGAELVTLRFFVEAYINYGDYNTMVEGVPNPNFGSQDLRLGKNYVLKTMRIELDTVITALEVVND